MERCSPAELRALASMPTNVMRGGSQTALHQHASILQIDVATSFFGKAMVNLNYDYATPFPSTCQRVGVHDGGVIMGGRGDLNDNVTYHHHHFVYESPDTRATKDRDRQFGYPKRRTGLHQISPATSPNVQLQHRW